tara:strand:- start:832 stop:942 length:111 start_codon:yes stop_codon:yes gene_type:complete
VYLTVVTNAHPKAIVEKKIKIEVNISLSTKDFRSVP